MIKIVERLVNMSNATANEEAETLERAADLLGDLIIDGHGLAKALQDYGFPMSEEAWRNTGYDAPVNNQASREAQNLSVHAKRFLHLLDRVEGKKP